MPNRIIDEQTIFQEYVIHGKSDREIAQEYGCHKTTVAKNRQQFGITTRLTTGEIGERLVHMELLRLGFTVVDMNRTESKTYPFDLLVNQRIRVDVKSAKANQDGYWRFALTVKKECGHSLETGNFVLLDNGRIRKVFEKTSDFLVFCAIGESINFYVLPPTEIPIKQNTVAISSDHCGKWSYWQDRWDLLKRLAA